MNEKLHINYRDKQTLACIITTRLTLMIERTNIRLELYKLQLLQPVEISNK